MRLINLIFVFNHCIMKKVLLISACSLLFLLVSAQSNNELIPGHKLINDTRQLLNILETAHPDPYQNPGGKIALHRSFQNILSSIPSEGMTRTDFYNLLLPFIAMVGDMHTGLRSPEEKKASPGLLLDFRIIEKDLVITGVPSKDYESLLGGRLQSVEQVSITELMNRQSKLRGVENDYGRLIFLSRNLKTLQGIKKLIPEMKSAGVLTATILLPSKELRTVKFDLLQDKQTETVGFPTAVKMPSTEKSDVVFGFPWKDKETALLVVQGMEQYREACECWFADGMAEAGELTGNAYKQFNKVEPPVDQKALLKGIPSATETFISLIEEMKRAGTKNLIVDLRENTGGHSMMKEMLLYFLYGIKGLQSMNQGYQIIKYSDLYFSQFSSDSLPLINKVQPVALENMDYNFQDERWYKNGIQSFKEANELMEENFRKSPTFWDVYKSEKYHTPVYTPKNIIVLCSPLTTSSGFNMLTTLSDAGAKVEGTPSAQPANNFGDILFFTLPESNLKGYVAFKYNITYPDDPAKGRCMMPDYLLSYDKFVTLRFDPNAEVIYAKEILDKL